MDNICLCYGGAMNIKAVCKENLLKSQVRISLRCMEVILIKSQFL